MLAGRLESAHHIKGSRVLIDFHRKSVVFRVRQLLMPTS